MKRQIRWGILLNVESPVKLISITYFQTPVESSLTESRSRRTATAVASELEDRRRRHRGARRSKDQSDRRKNRKSRKGGGRNRRKKVNKKAPCPVLENTPIVKFLGSNVNQTRFGSGTVSVVCGGGYKLNLATNNVKCIRGRWRPKTPTCYPCKCFVACVNLLSCSVSLFLPDRNGFQYPIDVNSYCIYWRGWVPWTF